MTAGLEYHLMTTHTQKHIHTWIMFYWYSLHLHVIASQSSISWIKLEMKAPPPLCPSCVGHIQQHMLCLCQSNSLWQIGADEWLQAQQKWILPLPPCRPQLFLRTPPPHSCWARIGTGSRHSARTKADQWHGGSERGTRSLGCTADVQSQWSSDILHVSVELSGRWARSGPGPLWSALLTIWPQSELRLMCQGIVCVVQ